MKAKSKRTRGLVSLLFAATLAFGMMPATALAEDHPDTPLPPDKGNLHIHKYLGDGTVAPGDPNEGTVIDPLPSSPDWEPIGDITFDIYKVDANADGDYPGTKPYRLSGTTLTDGAGDTFNVTPATTPSVTTDTSGNAVASDLPQGVYLVVEQYDDRVTTPADPFVVAVPMTDAAGSGWITDVHVYPKNFSMTAIKEIKSPAGSEQTGTAVNVGDLVTYSIIPTVPTDIVAYEVDATGAPTGGIDSTEDASIKYSVTDELLDALTFVDAAPNDLKVYGLTAADDKHSGGTLIPRTGNYTVAGNVVIDFTAAGRALLYAGSGTSSAPVPYSFIRIELSATVNSNILDSVKYPASEVENKATVGFTNRWDQDTESGTNTVTIHNAAISIIKKDRTSGVALSGAEFKIADTEANAKAGNYLKILPLDHATRPGAIVDPADPDYGNAAAVDWLATSDSNGKFTFDGIEDYTSVMDNDGNETKTYLSYWLVETKAPNGYNLPADPFKFTFDGSETGYTIEMDIHNTNEFVLPLTGGAGTLLLTIVGVALVGGGAVALFFSRKKKAAVK